MYGEWNDSSLLVIRNVFHVHEVYCITRTVVRKILLIWPWCASASTAENLLYRLLFSSDHLQIVHGGALWQSEEAYCF